MRSAWTVSDVCPSCRVPQVIVSIRAGLDILKTTMSTPAKLIFLCGKMAAGKSTLARELAQPEHAILVVQDDFLEALYPGEITNISGFGTRYSRLKDALTPYICALL